MIQWTLISFTRKARKGKEKCNDKGKGKPKGKSKGKGKQNEKGKSIWERQVKSRKIPRYLQELWQDRTQVERTLGEKRGGPRNKRTMSVRRRKLVT